MRVLAAALDVTSPVDLDRLRHARRDLAYDVLVVFVADPESPLVLELVAGESALGGDVRRVVVDPDDARACMASVATILTGLATEATTVRMVVSTGTTPMAVAALMACLQTSTEAWFFDGGRAHRLAVPQRHVVEERFDDAQRAVLEVLREPASVTAIIERTGLTRPIVQGALLKLRNGALVQVSPGLMVEPTPVGAYYRAHLVR